MLVSSQDALDFAQFRVQSPTEATDFQRIVRALIGAICGTCINLIEDADTFNPFATLNDREVYRRWRECVESLRARLEVALYNGDLVPSDPAVRDYKGILWCCTEGQDSLFEAIYKMESYMHDDKNEIPRRVVMTFVKWTFELKCFLEQWKVPIEAMTAHQVDGTYLNNKKSIAGPSHRLPDTVQLPHGANSGVSVEVSRRSSATLSGVPYTPRGQMDGVPTPVTAVHTLQINHRRSGTHHVDRSVISTGNTGKTTRAIQKLQGNHYVGPVLRTLASRSSFWPMVVIFACFIVGAGVAALFGKAEDIWLQLGSFFLVLMNVYLLAIVPCFRSQLVQKHLFWFISLLVLSVSAAVAALVFWRLHHYKTVASLFLAAGLCQAIAVAQFTDGVANETGPNPSGCRNDHNGNESNRMSTFSVRDVHNVSDVHTPNTVRTVDSFC